MRNYNMYDFQRFALDFGAITAIGFGENERVRPAAIPRTTSLHNEIVASVQASRKTRTHG